MGRGWRTVNVFRGMVEKDMVSKLKRTARNVWRFFFPKITYRWCVVNPIGTDDFGAFLLKCRNGKPEGTGWFVTIWKCQNEQVANDLVKDLEESRQRWRERHLSR